MKGRSELPGYVERYMSGEIELDSMVTHTMSLEEINKAFDWLEDLAELQEKQQFSPVKETSTRIFSQQEKKLIGIESIGFLHFLEQTNILTPVTRELILDRVIALGQPLDAEQMKWIIMIVLHAHPGEENALALMENFIFDEAADLIQ